MTTSETPIFDTLRAERFHPVPADAAANQAASDVQHVGSLITTDRHERWFGLPWLRAGRG